MPNHAPDARLSRSIGAFDVTMLVMGGIVGSGIFANPAEVARSVGSPAVIVGVWIVGGAIAMLGAFIYAELAARRPEVGGQYAYLRDAWGPVPGFLYGWALLLVIQSGGMAAVAIAFAGYLRVLVELPVSDGLVAVGVLALLTAINCLGVKAGATVQSSLMVLKIVAIAALVLIGLWLTPAATMPSAVAPAVSDSLAGFAAALAPVMFSYGGWQTSSFVAGEMRDPVRDLARGLMLGVAGVVILYAAVAFTCVAVLGPAGLAGTRTPASDVLQLALGPKGAALMALGIAISALGFLSQSILTAPRVYFAMAEDGLFFRGLAKVDARTRVPVRAILLQGAAAAAIALSGQYGEILSYVVSTDFLFFGLTAAALFVFRRGDRAELGFSVPLHPITTVLFILACAVIVVATVASSPVNSLIGYLILALGVPVCLLFRARQRGSPA